MLGSRMYIEMWVIVGHAFLYVHLNAVETKGPLF